MYSLRFYQRDALDLTYEYLRRFEGNPVINLPTGSGKSIVIAAFCHEALTQWPATRILKLTSRKELIVQNYEKLISIWPNAPVGIYSASIGSRDIDSITFAGIQSVRTRAVDLGRIDLVIIDEAHEINHEETGAYRKLIADLKTINPALRVIGLTATPYRMGHGLITDKPAIFDQIIEPTSIRVLQEKGFLAMVRSKHTALTLDVSGVAKRGGEYVEGDLQKVVDTDMNTIAAVEETIRRAADRKAWLFFCSGIDHAEHVRDALHERGITAETVTGKTSDGERDRIIGDFKAGKIKAITNANLLTTGFDYPDIDLIVMLRPTCSPGLYMQMVGRGLRIKSHGGDCLVLDFAGNVAEHGPIIAVNPPKKAGKGDGIAPSKICPECDEMLPIQVKVCPACGYVFTPEDNEKYYKLHNDDISGVDRVRDIVVDHWAWSIQTSRTSGKDMLVCRYYPEGIGTEPIIEYFCVWHDGFAGVKARKEMLKLCNLAGLSAQPSDTRELDNAVPPSMIKVIKDGKFNRIIDRIWTEQAYDDVIPF